MLNLKDIELSYGRKKVIQNLSLEVMEHELYALVGPESSGKSSVCRVAAGVVQPDKGTVLLYGKNIMEEESYKWNIGYLPEKVEMYQYQQVLEYLMFFGELYGMETKEARSRALFLLEMVELAQKQEDMLTNLSKGERQKLLISRAMLHSPAFLVLDGALTGLDPVSKVELQALLLKLKKCGVSILLSSNDLDSVSKFCDRIAIIDGGVIVAAGTVDEIQHLKQSSNPIVIRVNGRMDEAMLLLRSNPHITSLSRKEQLISVWFDGKNGEEASILKELIENGIEVTAFYREESDFDSLYLRIAKR